MSIFGKIFGSDSIIGKGLGLIDEIWTSDEEKAENKIKLLNAYAPFKIAQRYLAVIFTITYVSSYLLTLTLHLAGLKTDGVTEIMATFRIGLIMLTIVGFYFGGGVIDSIKRKPNSS